CKPPCGIQECDAAVQFSWEPCRFTGQFPLVNGVVANGKESIALGEGNKKNWTGVRTGTEEALCSAIPNPHAGEFAANGRESLISGMKDHALDLTFVIHFLADWFGGSGIPEPGPLLVGDEHCGTVRAHGHVGGPLRPGAGVCAGLTHIQQTSRRRRIAS